MTSVRLSGVRTGVLMWVTTLVALIACSLQGIAGIAVVLAAGVALATGVRRRLGVDMARGLLVVLLLAPVIVSWRVLPLLESPLADLAGSRAVVSAEVVVSTDPQPRAGRTSGSRRSDDGWQLDAEVLRLSVPGGATSDLDLPVRVLTDQDLTGVLPGDRKSIRLNSSHVSQSRMPSSA